MNKAKEHEKWFLVPVAAVLLLVCVTAGLLVFRSKLQSDLQKTSCETLDNVLAQQRFAFATRLQDQKNSIKIYAHYFEYASDISREILLEKLNIITQSSTFDNLTIATPDGAALENTGVTLNVADRGYFKSALLGETVIAGPIVSKTNGKQIVIFSTPIYYGDKVEAVLIAVYSADALSGMLLPSFSGKGYTYVTSSTGEVIFKTATNSTLALNSNLFDALETVDVQKLDEITAIRFQASTGKGGHATYTHDGEERMMHYEPIGINDWYIFSVAPKETINPYGIGIMYTTTLVVLIITILTSGSFIFIIMSQKKHMLELNTIAYVDTLTKAPNKKQFKLKAATLLENINFCYAFVLLDIDKFKVLNDRFGFDCGDSLLVDIAAILNGHMGPQELFGRCDSDEFYILISYTDDRGIRARVQNIMEEIEKKFRKRVNNSYSLVLCAGIYMITNPKESINAISDKARHAHRLIKGRDGSGISFYNEEMRNRILEEKEIENRMHDALQNNEFLLYLQPKFYLTDEKIYGAEALVRWNSSGHIIYPNDFIPLFEKNGFITKLDMYMLDKACQTIRAWMDAGVSPVPISINFSRLHLKNLKFVDDIAKIVHSYHIPAHLIEVELTESSMLHNEDVLINMLKQLHNYGFTLSMDDFGSGYSSLGLLKNLPVDVIKLDRTFFVDYCELKRAVTVVASIIAMAKNLEIKTVAEGVETKEQITFLKELGCDIVQGYYFAKPMAAVEVNALLNKEYQTI